MNVQQWQIQIERAMAWSIGLTLVFTAIGIWISYEVLKAAIRNGINESNLGRNPAAKQTPAPPGYKWELVKEEHVALDIRADR